MIVKIWPDPLGDVKDRFYLRVSWPNVFGKGEIMYLTREELRDLADTIIAYELTLEESEQRKPA